MFLDVLAAYVTGAGADVVVEGHGNGKTDEHEGWDERRWGRLIKQIQQGDCTPFLGAGACSPTLPKGADLSSIWAERYGYPFEDGEILHEVMQYASIIEGDPVVVKQDVRAELSDRGEPDYRSPALPHTLLAKYPIKVFLTTNYDNFMTNALQMRGKSPVTAICPWYLGAENDPMTTLPDGYEPSVEEPLVYHLHGSALQPSSMVLAAEDYVEFIVNLARDLGQEEPRVVPHQILPALTRKPLLFVGYSLRDLSFRMLYHGFVDQVATVQKRLHISVQLAPKRDRNEGMRRRAEDYLTRYFARLNISVYWGEAADFCVELTRRLAAAPLP